MLWCGARHVDARRWLVSFDLGFWWEPRPISAVEAEQKYLAMVDGDTGVVEENVALEEFCNDLNGRFPDLTEETLETSPWSSPVYRTNECVIISMPYSRGAGMVDGLRKLAAGHGVSCYNPHSGEFVFPNESEVPKLQLADGSEIVGPGEPDVRRAIVGLSTEDWFAILETAPQWYIQVGFGAEAGVPVGSYVIELREGGADRHSRAITHDVGLVVDAFLRFLISDYSWRSSFQFSPVSL
jgi:hypothetical protein